MATGILTLANRISLEPVAFRHLCLWRRRNQATESSQPKPMGRVHYSTTHLLHNAQSQPRINPVGIKMIPERLYKQVFGPAEDPYESYDDQIKQCLQHLRSHDLLPKPTGAKSIGDHHRNSDDPSLSDYLSTQNILTSTTATDINDMDDIYDVQVDIPKLEGDDIDQHFLNLGQQFSLPYKELADLLLKGGVAHIDKMPVEWNNKPGWTRYEPKHDGSNSFLVTSVESPLEKTYVFDVETCINDKPNHTPTLAVAVSDKAWYSWCSQKLSSIMEQENSHSPNEITQSEEIHTNLLIPLGSSQQECLVIGHNVGFDRSFIKDQYSFHPDKIKFLDTLSIHMCICGFTGLQRAVKMAHKRKLKSDEPIDEIDLDKIRQGWLEQGSLNNLADVYKFHCGKEISKDEREIFVKGTMNDVARDFQSLMTYCGRDVSATFRVFESIYKQFNERFPHPITLSGMLEMSTMYLPVKVENWNRYIGEAQLTFDECELSMKNSLTELANKCCSLTPEQYTKDVWLWDLDWTVKRIVPNKTKLNAWVKARTKAETSSSKQQSIEEKVQQIYDTKQFMRQKMPHLAGFPQWYRELCISPDSSQVLSGEKAWSPGPCLLSTQMRVTPKLLRLVWDGYPVHHHPEHGWGYLVPDDNFMPEYACIPEGHPYEKFPYREFLEMCKDLPRKHMIDVEVNANDEFVDDRIDEIRDATQEITKNISSLFTKLSRTKTVSPKYRNEYCPDVEIPGALFFRLPHKGGPSNNVGNPLSKDFSRKVQDGSLTALDNEITSKVLECANALSYWKNNHKRIKGQMVVPLPPNDVDNSYGAILPRVIVSGTVTRRAVEPTWLTASNQDQARIGSELKAMVQTPKGYSFVGADVDSQELWIASLYGDAYSYKIHGGTGLSYMTLRGTKTNKTDMHSKTASLIGISRKEAKILNYARIYGAGIKFVQRFLLQNDHKLTISEANEKARKIFKETKGTAVLMDKVKRRQWVGGTESATFNKLEEIASAKEPRTPVLNCQISKALEPSSDADMDFGTSRMNWVVQSSAVDFLHLLLINMKWLFKKLDIDGRFSISIHDEVRYIVKHEDRFKAAYALQLTNLLVRAYFAYKLNMRDLPISVAFFTSVDIDTCLRKEVDLDCQSPSNKLGLSRAYNIPYGESLDIKQIISRMKEEL